MDDAQPPRRRVWILPAAAIVIFGLCVWRMSRPPRPIVETTSTEAYRQPALRSEFALLDQHSKPVKPERYFGRQRLLLRFLGNVAPESDDVLRWLRDHQTRVTSGGYAVIGVTPLPPSATRSTTDDDHEWPFPILSDIVIGVPSPAPLHHQWGSIDAVSKTPTAGLFVVDREGLTEWRAGSPRAVPSPLDWLHQTFGEP